MLYGIALVNRIQIILSTLCLLCASRDDIRSKVQLREPSSKLVIYIRATLYACFMSCLIRLFFKKFQREIREIL